MLKVYFLQDYNFFSQISYSIKILLLLRVCMYECKMPKMLPNIFNNSWFIKSLNEKWKIHFSKTHTNEYFLWKKRILHFSCASRVWKKYSEISADLNETMTRLAQLLFTTIIMCSDIFYFELIIINWFIIHRRIECIHCATALTSMHIFYSAAIE